tara:strand:+ start:144 stop:671 length:528 start_codon:yes stop_codon:yes gene_type:complete
MNSLQKCALITLSFIFGASVCVRAEEFQTEGIETLTSENLDEIIIQKNIFVGQCPGAEYTTTDGYFVDYNNMPANNLRVKIVNFGRGLSPSNPPYTDRAYDSGRASEIIKMAIGKGHARRYFALRKGLNPLKYKIYNDVSKITIKEGTIMLRAFVNESTYRRDKKYDKYEGKYVC